MKGKGNTKNTILLCNVISLLTIGAATLKGFGINLLSSENFTLLAVVYLLSVPIYGIRIYDLRNKDYDGYLSYWKNSIVQILGFNAMYMGATGGLHTGTFILQIFSVGFIIYILFELIAKEKNLPEEKVRNIESKLGGAFVQIFVLNGLYLNVINKTVFDSLNKVLILYFVNLVLIALLTTISFVWGSRKKV